MPCDERYRAWAMRHMRPAAAPPPPGMYRAALVYVSPCAARPGFRELHFDVDGTAWSWCFPPTAEPRGFARPGALTVSLRPGPHGLVARASTAEVGSLPQPAGLDLAVAADLAISGVPVLVHCFLIGRAATDETRLGQARLAAGGAPGAVTAL